jgi:catechol 2,3-dioxygenase-like lactoylglutathione lyase family enzyme
VNDSSFIPILRVKDARRSAQFYGSNLGFTTDWEHRFGPDFPLFISISRGSLQLFLSEHSGTGTDEADLYLFVPDVDSLHAQFASAGVTIERPPADQPWGVREMRIRDLDRHRITFAARNEDRETTATASARSG